MITSVFQTRTQTFLGLFGLLCVSSSLILNSSAAWAEGTTPTPTNTTNMNNAVCDTVGNCLNGSTNNGNMNSNQNNLSTGSNNNQLYAPNQSLSTGGTSALVLPRNPLSLNNANLGRSNFGLQFGLNNNPILGNLNSMNGKTDALSWFLQGGVTVPFGKIPDMLKNTPNNKFDDIRMQRMQDEREVFGSVRPQQQAAQTNVQGKVVRLNAYNYATSASPKLEGMKEGLMQIEADKAALAAPKVLALAESVVFSKPLGKGDKIGSVQTGEEYRYIGHTNSGWVKVILSNGREGWVKGQFEYLKSDYTEIDTITMGNPVEGMKQASASKSSNARKQ